MHAAKVAEERKLKEAMTAAAAAAADGRCREIFTFIRPAAVVACQWLQKVYFLMFSATQQTSCTMRETLLTSLYPVYAARLSNG